MPGVRVVDEEDDCAHCPPKGTAVFTKSSLVRKHGAPNMYDTTQPAMQTTLGPCEDDKVLDQPSAQTHYFRREIKFRDPRGLHFEPETSYRHHYPPKELPRHDPMPVPQPSGAPFQGSSEYAATYQGRQGEPPARIEPLSPNTAMADLHARPWLGRETTNQRFYKPWPIEPQPPTEHRVVQLRHPGTLVGDTFTTHNHVEYPPKESSYEPQRGQTMAQPLAESRVKETTHNYFYKPHRLMQLRLIPREELPESPPLDDRTTYGMEFGPKSVPRELPPLEGFKVVRGVQLALPRRSLGCEMVGDRYYVLIPYSLPVPCCGKQIFTTVHDNQEEATILVLYGESSRASNNALLGQFDITHIPPAPKDVPRIEVCFHLDENLVLTAEARDLDTGRHKQWKQNGGTIELRQTNLTEADKNLTVDMAQ